MRLSRYFLPVLKEDPAEAEIISHRLMLRAGLVRQTSAGIYAWLPLGLRVLKKIEDIVRDEQTRAGALEALMPTIQSADLWKQSGRYDGYGREMLRITDRHDREMLYGPTNEEMITDIFRNAVRSYRDLPVNLFHIQWKFRDEIRPRFGVMRGREFLMKDGYSFDVNAEEGQRSYHRMFVSYLRTFDRLGLRAIPMVAETGPIGGDMSHEFIILADTGESEIFCHGDLLSMPAPDASVDYDGDLKPIIENWTSLYAATSEKHDSARFEANVPSDKRIKARGIEGGHIFFFGDKYSKPMGAEVVSTDGKQVAVQSGSYGIGVSRLVGGIIEACHDDKGIVWPESVAPFLIGLVNLKAGDEDSDSVCERLYRRMSDAGVEVLYDDTDERAGAKFSTMDLIGLPWQIIVGPRGLAEGVAELKCRATGSSEILIPDDILSRFIN
ncbi:MAG: proline--tRNA ligase [Parvularculales bacterium]